jgi:hypothetical protein
LKIGGRRGLQAAGKEAMTPPGRQGFQNGNFCS